MRKNRMKPHAFNYGKQRGADGAQDAGWWQAERKPTEKQR